MNKLLLGAVALTASFSSLADPDVWRVNDLGVPAISEKSSYGKVMGLYNVCDSITPTIVLGDTGIPDNYIGNTVSFKARIDRNKIHDVTAEYVELHAEMNGVMLEIDKTVFKTFLSGEAIRFQFPATNGSKIIETYSLNGVTKAYQDALALCGDAYFDDDLQSSESFF